jgi:ATP-binding cassette subfamily F protein 3
LDDYKQWTKERLVGGGRPEASGERQVSRKDERRVEAQTRQREAQARKPFEKKLAAIEAELAPLQAEATAADAWLASSEAYEEGQRERLQATLKRQAELRARITALEDDWLWMQAQMDQEVNRARE